MRTLRTIAAVAALGPALPALAQTYVGTPLSPPELQAKVVEAVASRLPEAPAVRIRDLRASLARNGRGYCGLASPDATSPYQPFHVLVDQDGSLAVLILPEQGDPPGLSRADAVLLLTNLGCIS